MEWYEDEVRNLEQHVRDFPPPIGSIVFYGSSSMRMWESLATDFPDIDLINMAFGGSTLEACAWFFKRLVVPCNPRAIVCYAGDNDLGDGKSPEDVERSLIKLIAAVDAFFPAIPFTMLSIKPSPSRWNLADKITRTNEAIRRVVLSRHGGHFIDVYTAMLGSDGRPDDTLFLEDGLHVSPKGYLVWQSLLAGRAADIFP